MAVTQSCVLGVSHEGQEERAALELCSVGLCHVLKCSHLSSSTSKPASDKQVIRHV